VFKGSGNAFTKNICLFSQETYCLEGAMYILGKGQKKAVDLMKFETEDDEIIYSFLAFSWAIIADIDLESERYIYPYFLCEKLNLLFSLKNTMLWRKSIHYLGHF